MLADHMKTDPKQLREFLSIRSINATTWIKDKQLPIIFDERLVTLLSVFGHAFVDISWPSASAAEPARFRVIRDLVNGGNITAYVGFRFHWTTTATYVPGQCDW